MMVDKEKLLEETTKAIEAEKKTVHDLIDEVIEEVLSCLQRQDLAGAGFRLCELKVLTDTIKGEKYAE